MAHAETHEVAPGVTVRAIDPLHFVATKLEAWRGRGGGDYRESHDLEDLLAVVAGLPALRAEVQAAAREASAAVRTELAALARDGAFLTAVWGHFDGDDEGQRRAARLVEWLRALGRGS